MRRMLRALALSLVPILVGSAAMADNWTVKDSTGATVTLGSKAVSGVQYQQHTLVDASGAAVGTSGNPMAVAGVTTIATSTITRPADTAAYAVGDILCASTTAGSCAPFQLQVCRVAGGTGMIRALRLKASGAAATNVTIRVHLYRDLPTPTNGDNGAWLTTESTALGYADVGLSEVYSDAVKGYGTRSIGSEWNYDCASGSQVIYAYPEVRTAFTPSSASVWTLAAESLPN